MNPEKATIAVALLSVRRLSNQQLATLNLKVHAGWSSKECSGYDVVETLFDDDGQLIHPLLKDAFVIEVNRRVDGGEWK